MVDAEAVYHRIGPSKIHIFENTQAPVILFQYFAAGKIAVGADDGHFPRLDIPDEAETGAVQSAAFRGKGIAVLIFAQAQGAEAPAVPHGDHRAVGGQDDQRKGAPQLADGGGHSRLQIFIADDFIGDQGRNHLAVRGGGKGAAVLGQHLLELPRVDDVAVVNHGNAPPQKLCGHRLHVGAHIAAGGGIAHMALADAGGGQLV